MQTILVTGHTGFIGSNLVSYLKSKGYNVMGISNSSKKSQLKQIRKDVTKVSASDIKGSISCIIHLAALTDVDYCQKNPQKCFEVNVMGTQKILEIAKKKKTKLIFLSSSHVFGKPSRIPIHEDDPKKPLSLYGGSKLSGEILCELYSRNFGLDVSVVRLFSVFGVKHKGNDVISKIIFQLKHGDTIKLGNMFPRRDFVYVDDVIAALSTIIKKTNGFHVYNVGTGKSHSILEVCNLSAKLCGKKITIKSTKKSSRKNDIETVVADLSKIQRLGWKPKTSLSEGLTNLLQKEGMLM